MSYDLVGEFPTVCPKGHPATVDLLRVEVTTFVFKTIRGLGRCPTCLAELFPEGDTAA